MKKKVAEWLPELAPCPFDNQDFFKTWLILLNSPKWKKKPLSAIEMACKRLQRFDVTFATQLVESAIEGNYQGVVFPDSQRKFEIYKNNLNGINYYGTSKQNNSHRAVITGDANGAGSL